MIVIKCDFCFKSFRTYQRYFKRTKTHCCSHSCSMKLRNTGKFGKNHPRYSGGKPFKLGDGYMAIYHQGKGVPAHRFIVEQRINRPLKEEEVIHHIDHNRSNNTSKNLIIVSKKENLILNGLIWKYLNKNVRHKTIRKATLRALREIRNGSNG